MQSIPENAIDLVDTDVSKIFIYWLFPIEDGICF